MKNKKGEQEMKCAEIVKKFINDERGTETVEWAIIIGIIAVGAIGFITTIGTWVVGKFQTLSTSLP